MKKAIVLAVIAACFASGAQAADKSKALTLCKSYVNENYADATRRKVTRIKERASSVEVKYSISEAGEKIKGRCLVKNGEVNFTSDNMAVATKG
jgi:opacity protein-like surface antigen